MQGMDWKRHIKVLGALHWFILLILSGLSFFLADPSFTLGVILGGLVVISNFNIMQHGISHAFGPRGGTEKTKAIIVVKFYLRLLGLGIILYILVQWEWVNNLGLIVGLSTLFLSIVVFAIRKAVRSKTGEGT